MYKVNDYLAGISRAELFSEEEQQALIKEASKQQLINKKTFRENAENIVFIRSITDGKEPYSSDQH